MKATTRPPLTESEERSIITMEIVELLHSLNLRSLRELQVELDKAIHPVAHQLRLVLGNSV